MNAQKLEQVETKIAFLERANAELSDVVFRQQREIEALRAQLGVLAARVDAAHSDTGVGTPRDLHCERCGRRYRFDGGRLQPTAPIVSAS